MPRRRAIAILALAFAALFPGEAEHSAAAEPALRIATFHSEITPRLGSPLCGGWIKPLVGIDDPLWAKGVVLEAAGRRYVLCALDWCELCSASHDDLRARLAEAAGTKPSLVAVQCLHQHNAPIIDAQAQRLIAAQENPPPLMDAESFRDARARLGAAVSESLQRLEACDRLATGQARVERVASTRRIPAPGGGVRVRYSSAQEAQLRELPEGLIDPELRTISFLAGERPLLRLHYYATHPQSYYGDGRASSEFPGLARDQLEREEGVFQIYFTGCAGNVAAGKYNDGSPQARVELTERMVAGMRAAIAASRPRPIGEIGWQTVEVPFAMRDDARFSESAALADLKNPQADAQLRLVAALNLSFRERSRQPLELCALRLGDVRILHLPGEPFVEFQLLAQRLAPDAFVAVAGYGNGGPGYLCTEKAFAEGGYEPTASRVVPESETVLGGAIRKLLGVE